MMGIFVPLGRGNYRGHTGYVVTESGCWQYVGYLDKYGYGKMHDPVARRTEYAHRYAWTMINGQIPHGLSLDHLCRNPSCVRPDHLEPVTHRTNVLRGISPGAKCAARSHCNIGHELAGDNLYIRSDGSRRCRACEKLRRTTRAKGAGK